MPEIPNLAAPSECKTGDYMQSVFHKEASATDQANSPLLINGEVSNIRATAFNALHAESAATLNQSEIRLVRQLVQLHHNPELEKSVIDRLATADPSQKLPVVDLVLNDKGLQGLKIVPGCGDITAKNSDLTAFYTDIDKYAADPTKLRNYVKQREVE